MHKNAFLELRTGNFIFNKETGQVLELTSDLSLGCDDIDTAWLTALELDGDEAVRFVLISDSENWEFVDLENIIKAFTEASPLFRAAFTVILHRLKVVESITHALVGVSQRG